MQQRDTHDRSDLYAILGVDPSATPVEIRAAYRQRALVLHGDSLDRARAPAARTRATEMLRELNEAYRILRNPPLPREHDLQHAGRRPLTPRPARSSPDVPRPTVRALRPTVRATRPAVRKKRPAIASRRSLGRMAIVLGFGLLVLWAVLTDMVERRDAEAFFLSQPPSDASTEPLR